MKKTARMLCLLLAVLMLCSLTACGKKKDQPAQETGGQTEQTAEQSDIQALVQGRLDAIYRGEYSDRYLKLSGRTAEECQAERDDNLSVNVNYFALLFEIDYLTEDIRSELTELYEQLFSQVKYTVGAEAQMDDDNYVVTVEVQPADLVVQMNEAWDEWMEPYYSKYPSGLTDGLSESELQKRDAEQARYVLDLAKEKMGSLGFQDPEPLAVHVMKNEEGKWVVSDDSIYEIDQYVVRLPDMGV